MASSSRGWVRGSPPPSKRTTSTPSAANSSIVRSIVVGGHQAAGGAFGAVGRREAEAAGRWAGDAHVEVELDRARRAPAHVVPQPLDVAGEGPGNDATVAREQADLTAMGQPGDDAVPASESDVVVSVDEPAWSHVMTSEDCAVGGPLDQDGTGAVMVPG